MVNLREQNYWPGFVDALSNVELTLVFVLVVIVFALMLASNKIEQKVAEISRLADARQMQKAVTEEEMLDLRRELRETLDALQKAQSLSGSAGCSASGRRVDVGEEALAQAETAALKGQVDSLRRVGEGSQKVKSLVERQNEIVVKARPDQRVSKESAEAASDGAAVVVVFPTGVFDLNDKARAELEAALAPYRARLAGATPMLRSLPGAETYSEGRRLAYYRGLTVRNFLIDKKFGTGRSIQMVLDQAKGVDDGRVEIRFVRP